MNADQFKTEDDGILAAYGVPDHSPYDISTVLSGLGVGHTIMWREGLATKSKTIEAQKEGQKSWPIIVDSVRLLPLLKLHGRYIAYVTDARAALSLSNIDNSMWAGSTDNSQFLKAIKQSLKVRVRDVPKWSLTRREPSLMEYVNKAVKPSQLNDFQTLVCKINPYTLRKEIQTLFIGYLASSVKGSVLKAKLNSSYRLAPLLDLMKAERTQELRKAVAQVKAGADLEVVCTETDFESFEIMYILKASAARSADQ